MSELVGRFGEWVRGLDLPLEQWRLISAGVAAVVGALVGIAALGPTSHPLYGGQGSVAEAAVFTAAAMAVIAFVVWFIRAAAKPHSAWRRNLGTVRRILDLVGLTLVHGSIVMFGLAGSFWILSEGFRELTLDRFAGGAIVGVCAAGAVYLVSGSAMSVTTRSVGQLLAVFVITGGMSSMLTAANPLWWQQHFSALGTATDVSGMAFNFTLLLGGLAIITLSDYLTHDLGRWARLAQVSPRRVSIVRFGFVGMGVLLGLLAFLPVNHFFVAHNITAYSMVGLFILMAGAVPFLFPQLSKVFTVVCVVTVASLLLGLVMFTVIHYLNLTAFELLAVAGIFSWVVLFISTVEAAATHVAQRAPEAEMAPVASKEEPAPIR